MVAIKSMAIQNSKIVNHDNSGTMGDGELVGESELGAWMEVGPGVVEIETKPSGRLNVCVGLQSPA